MALQTNCTIEASRFSKNPCVFFPLFSRTLAKTNDVERFRRFRPKTVRKFRPEVELARNFVATRRMRCVVDRVGLNRGDLSWNKTVAAILMVFEEPRAILSDRSDRPANHIQRAMQARVSSLRPRRSVVSYSWRAHTINNCIHLALRIIVHLSQGSGWKLLHQSPDTLNAMVRPRSDAQSSPSDDPSETFEPPKFSQSAENRWDFALPIGAFPR